jgi:hypothetical protein
VRPGYPGGWRVSELKKQVGKLDDQGGEFSSTRREWVMNRRRTLGLAILAILAMFLIAIPVQADTIYWTNWTSVTTGQLGSASGTIALPTGDVNVTYSGDVYDTNPNILGNWNPPATFEAPPIVTNAPPGITNIAMLGGQPDTYYSFSFDKPVVNPVLAIMSLGSPSIKASMEFTAPFSILNTGGGLSLYNENGSFSQTGNTLFGSGANGIIQFQGTYSSIQWKSPVQESWSMVTVGAPVPLPPTVLLLGSGLLGLVGWRRFRKN